MNTDQWEFILPGYTSCYPVTFRCVVPFLLASLAYHRTWLESNLHHTHPLFLAPVWTSGTLREVGPQVLSGCLSNKVSRLRATGIPSSVVLAGKLDRMEGNIEKIAGNYQSINDKLETLPIEVRQKYNSIYTH